MQLGTGGAARDPLVRRTRGLRAEGYKTALVTNNVMEFREHWRGVLPLEELFDVVVDSSEVGMRKPNPAIFLHALDLLEGVAPERAVEAPLHRDMYSPTASGPGAQTTASATDASGGVGACARNVASWGNHSIPTGYCCIPMRSSTGAAGEAEIPALVSTRMSWPP